jgi:WXG100 family type VII secretion target
VTAFVVDLDALDASVALMQARSNAIAAALDTLDSHIAALHDVWTGEAATAQRVAHEQWREGARRMREALDAMRDAARTAHGNYTAAITANQQMWS